VSATVPTSAAAQRRGRALLGHRVRLDVWPNCQAQYSEVPQARGAAVSEEGRVGSCAQKEGEDTDGSIRTVGSPTQSIRRCRASLGRC